MISFALKRPGKRSEVGLRFIQTRDPQERGTRVLDIPSCNGVVGVCVLVKCHRGSTRTLPPEDYTLRVTAETGDVVPYPLNCEPLIE
jgi:hypothetical protein